jgi:hypothetical protein
MSTLLTPSEKVRNFLDNYGQEDPVYDLFASTAIWIEPGNSSISGRYCGPESILSLCKEVIARSKDTFRVVEIVEIVGGERYVLGIIIVEGACDSRFIRTKDTLVFQFEDNKAVEVRIISEDQDEVDRFWE